MTPAIRDGSFLVVVGGGPPPFTSPHTWLGGQEIVEDDLSQPLWPHRHKKQVVKDTCTSILCYALLSLPSECE